jgi:hypothetical protein
MSELSSLLDTDFLNRVFEHGKEVIKADRDKFKIIWDAIELYCVENKLIISDRYALVGKQNELTPIFEKNYKIYTSNPFRHSNNLINKIHQLTKDEKFSAFCRLKTVQEQEEFTIEYDTRNVCTMYKLQKHKSTEPDDIIKPTDISGLLYMPAEIELIDVYHDLYTMNKPDAAREFETLLYEQVAMRKEKGILGSGDCKENKKNLLEAIKISLVKDWLYKHNKNKYILIGPWAHDWYKLGHKSLCVNLEKIQLVGNVQPSELLHELKIYVNQIHNFDITMREQELHIPKDFRTARYTYYMSIKSEKGTIEKPFLDLFNCANFEVIPYTVIDKIPIGHKWVLLRFLFIDLWIIRVVKTLGIISADVLDKKLVYLWNLIGFLRTNEEMTIGELQFMGTHKDYIVDKKISNLKEKMFYPYYPYMYFKENGKYRSI